MEVKQNLFLTLTFNPVFTGYVNEKSYVVENIKKFYEELKTQYNCNNADVYINISSNERYYVYLIVRCKKQKIKFIDISNLWKHGYINMTSFKSDEEKEIYEYIEECKRGERVEKIT